MRTSTSALAEETSALTECLSRISDKKRSFYPLSTYRFQFNKDFRFEDARALVSYLHRLGVSHCYASPILQARAGSSHGYDITDHNRINPEIGIEEEFRAFAEELKAHGMGLILDTVPNHMGIGPGSNPWWQDVLQNGRTSAYAEYFDIDWEPLKEELRNKVLIPILGNTYGEELEQGNIKLEFERGAFLIRYFENRIPVDPQSIPLIFAWFGDLAQLKYGNVAEVREFQTLLSELRHLPHNSTNDHERVKRRQERVPILLQRLGELSDRASIWALIQQALTAINGRPGDPASFDRLHTLLEAQVYRLAFWRVSGEEINYRRFFDINDLIGLRMEDPRVFAATHRLIRQLLGEGLVSGLRIDHPDGLLNPVQYFTRLQMLYAASQCCGLEPMMPLADSGIEVEIQRAFTELPEGDRVPLYLLVEKILERGEELPDWPVDGTVGYDFANLVNGVLIDHKNERYLTRLYERVIGRADDVQDVIYESKKLIMLRALSSEVNVLTHLLDQISMQDRRARDFTRSVLRNVIREAIACFPVYRTYIDERGSVSQRDRHYIELAIERAKRRNPEIAPAFDFLRKILLLRGTDQGPAIYGYRKQLYFTLKFQQLTGPVMAKGLEDTTCYRYNRFVSVNEVGGSPEEFGVSPEEFHHGNELRARSWPHSMLATSTHDTKRSEDVRARLNVLSEMPRQWSAHVMKWRRMNRARKVETSDGRLVPDNNEEYLLYQTIVGAMPMRIEGAQGWQGFTQRIQQYMEKAVHEAKSNLSWLNPNSEYVAALNLFIERILSPELHGKANLFYESLFRFMPTVKLFGALNSLTQTLLKLTCPGVPDIYQGQELWDFSLVDPDNRRPVNFSLRAQLLDEMQEQKKKVDPIAFALGLLRELHDGRIKLWMTECILNFRREWPALFSEGDYVPLTGSGSKAENVIAFARRHAGQLAVVAAPRLTYGLMRGAEELPIGGVWNETKLTVDPTCTGKELRNLFTKEKVLVQDNAKLLCRDLFAHFPFALLAT